MTKRHREHARFQLGIKDLGKRLEDEEFSQEFIEPIRSSLDKERTPARHCRQGHERRPPLEK